MFSKLDQKLTSFDSAHSELLKKLVFYERENKLLTEEKDKFYQEYISSFDIFKKERNSLNEKITLLEKSLKDKISEIKNIQHEKSNAVSLTNFFQKEREFLHQDLLDRELKIRKFQDAQNVYNRIRVNMNRRGLGFSKFDNKPGFKTNNTLNNTFCSGKIEKPKLPFLTSTFKRRKTSGIANPRRTLQMTNVRFDDYVESFSPSEKRNFIPKKYMSQKQIGLFKFGYPETQSDEAFVCIISP
jgi:hypothetical protein